MKAINQAEVLCLNSVETGYGKKQIIFGISMSVLRGEIIAIIGPNGCGKSTLLKSVFGLLPIWRGEIMLDGERLDGILPRDMVAKGVAFLPQGNRVFPELTVLENLEVVQLSLRDNHPLSVDAVIQLFPLLKQRFRTRAGQLSGGEQQMLAMARALLRRPRLLLLDEPSSGLAPGLVAAVFENLREAHREMGITVVLVEQKVREVLDFCDRAYAIKLGKVAYSGSPKPLTTDQATLRDLFL